MFSARRCYYSRRFVYWASTRRSRSSCSDISYNSPNPIVSVGLSTLGFTFCCFYNYRISRISSFFLTISTASSSFFFSMMRFIYSLPSSCAFLFFYTTFSRSTTMFYFFSFTSSTSRRLAYLSSASSSSRYSRSSSAMSFMFWTSCLFSLTLSW